MLLRSLKLYPLLEIGLEKEVDNRTVLVEGDKKTHLPAKVNGDLISKGLSFLKKNRTVMFHANGELEHNGLIIVPILTVLRGNICCKPRQLML